MQDNLEIDHFFPNLLWAYGLANCPFPRSKLHDTGTLTPEEF